MTGYDTIWDEIYGRGEQLNRYPFSSVVTFLFRHAPRTKPRGDTKILEIGCGAGNNLWFAAREGFAVSGLDASEAALDYARTRFAQDGLSAELVTGDFTKLPFADGEFDIVLERAALSQTPKPTARKAVEECARVLAPGGKIYCEIYSDRSTTRGRPIEGGLLVDTEGPFSGVGQIAFYGRPEIEALFAGVFKIVDLDHTETMAVARKPYEVFAHWAVIAERT
ncbi:MAG: class I SAM-dependent methyltransferase [Pseudomonadota bacterium]